MSKGELLADKAITLPKLFAALLVAAAIVAPAVSFLAYLQHHLEALFDHKEPGLSLPMTVALMPLTAIGMIALVVPVGIYIFDHAPFQSLFILRPDHYTQLLYRVFFAWSKAKNGKLASKEL